MISIDIRFAKAIENDLFMKKSRVFRMSEKYLQFCQVLFIKFVHLNLKLALKFKMIKLPLHASAFNPSIKYSSISSNMLGGRKVGTAVLEPCDVIQIKKKTFTYFFQQ